MMNKQMSDSEETVIMQSSSTFKTMRDFPNWTSIQEDLNQMVKGMKLTAITNILTKFRNYSLLDRKMNPYTFKKVCLKKLIEEYEAQIPLIFSKIASFVLKKGKFVYPLFKQKICLDHTFTKQEILYLLCSMILFLIPKQQYNEEPLNFQYRYNSHFDFSFIFKNESYKTKAIIEYIKKQINKQQNYNQHLTIRRIHCTKTIEQIIQQNGEKSMKRLSIMKNETDIEQFYGCLKVDFANMYIGGGCFTSGCVQEEIMFANHPQLFITPLICEVMLASEAIILTGFKRYHKNNGYSKNTKYDSLLQYQYTYDDKGRAKQYIIAIDAMPFGIKDKNRQYINMSIKRQLLKAYIGFNHQQITTVATGNWGCGAFGGNPQIKLLIQWIACSIADKQMIYCPFGEANKITDQQLYSKLKALKIYQMYDLLQKSTNILRRQILEHPTTSSTLYSILKQLMK